MDKDEFDLLMREDTEEEYANELNKQEQWEQEQEEKFYATLDDNINSFFNISIDTHKTLQWLSAYVKENKKTNNTQHQHIVNTVNKQFKERKNEL